MRDVSNEKDNDVNDKRGIDNFVYISERGEKLMMKI